MDKHFVLSKIKDYEAHLDNVAPLMESDDQLIMNEFAYTAEQNHLDRRN